LKGSGVRIDFFGISNQDGTGAIDYVVSIEGKRLDIDQPWINETSTESMFHHMIFAEIPELARKVLPNGTDMCTFVSDESPMFHDLRELFDMHELERLHSIQRIKEIHQEIDND
jgi:hypothetical protein